MSGYRFHLIFLWLPSADLAVARVAERVRRGGHDIPEATIRRRYATGLQNLFTLYLPMADTWRVLQSLDGGILRPVASGKNGQTNIYERNIWTQIKE